MAQPWWIGQSGSCAHQRGSSRLPPADELTFGCNAGTYTTPGWLLRKVSLAPRPRHLRKTGRAVVGPTQTEKTPSDQRDRGVNDSFRRSSAHPTAGPEVKAELRHRTVGSLGVRRQQRLALGTLSLRRMSGAGPAADLRLGFSPRRYRSITALHRPKRVVPRPGRWGRRPYLSPTPWAILSSPLAQRNPSIQAPPRP
jgi:hypothetical protein